MYATYTATYNVYYFIPFPSSLALKACLSTNVSSSFQSSIFIAAIDQCLPGTVFISYSRRLNWRPFRLFPFLGYKFKMVLLHFTAPLMVCPIHLHFSLRKIFIFDFFPISGFHILSIFLMFSMLCSIALWQTPSFLSVLQ